MSLNWDLTETRKNLGDELYDEITTSPWPSDDGKEKWHPVTESLIWLSMSVGLNHIHKDNVGEWTERMNALQAIYGADHQFGKEHAPEGQSDIYITREDIENHIGLRTNVGRKTKTAFYADLFRRAKECGARAGKRQGKSALMVMKDVAAFQNARNTAEEASDA